MKPTDWAHTWSFSHVPWPWRASWCSVKHCGRRVPALTSPSWCLREYVNTNWHHNLHAAMSHMSRMYCYTHVSNLSVTVVLLAWLLILQYCTAILTNTNIVFSIVKVLQGIAVRYCSIAKLAPLLDEEDFLKICIGIDTANTFFYYWQI